MTDINQSHAAWQRTVSLVLLPALAVFGVLLVDTTVFADGDSNWHVAAGRWIIAHGAVPGVDPFSYTAAGRPWVAHEWLSEVILAAIQATAGWAGVMLLIGVAAAATFAALAYELQRWMRAWSVVVVLALSFWLLAAHLYVRPHMLALPLLAIWMSQMLRARRQGRAPALWLLPLMVLWANLHGSYIFGLAFACPFAAEAVMEAFLAAKGRRLAAAFPIALRWGGFLAASGLAALLTPNGVRGLLLPFTVMRMKVLHSIAEWHAAGFDRITGFEVALFVGLFVCLNRGVRVGWARLGLLLLLVLMTLQHMRQEIILAVVGPMLLAEPLGRALAPERINAPSISPPPRREILAPSLVAVVLVLGLATWRLTTPAPRRDSPTVPITALAHVPPALAARPVFNDYSFGGWLVLKGVRPFIDGRADLYGDDFVQTYLDTEAVKSPGATAAILNRYGVAWTILSPGSPLVAYLDRQPDWRRLYADQWAVVQVRSAAATPSVKTTPP